MKRVSKTIIALFLLSSFICSLGKSIHSTPLSKHQHLITSSGLFHQNHSDNFSNNKDGDQSIPFLLILSEEWESEEEDYKKKINFNQGFFAFCEQSISNVLTYSNHKQKIYNTLNTYHSPLFILYGVFRL